MALTDDQVDGSNSELLGRFNTAVVAAAELIVEEPDTTPNHVERMALAVRLMREREAENFGRIMLRLALARNARMAVPRAEVTDNQIANIVSRYIGIFAVSGW